MSDTTNDRAGSAARRSGGRLSALLHTNLFSLGELISWIRWREPWWPAVLDRSGLTGAPRDRVFAIVKKTRLWNHERADVARELCNHAAEALDAGRAPDDVAASLGEPKTVARLIRRSVKRKRPLTWQVRAWTLRGLAVAACGVLLMAGFMTARLFIGSPTISRDFVAELNAPYEKYGPDERAWPLLRSAWASYGPKEHVAQRAMTIRASDYEIAMGQDDAFIEDHASTGIDLIPRLPEGHPDTDAVMALYRDIQGELDLMREAARRPVLGMLYSTKHEAMPESMHNTPEARGWLGEPIPDSADPVDHEMVIGILLPALGPKRIFCKWFAFDARVRIAEGDPAGAVGSIETMLRIADLAERDHFVIGYLVSMAIEALAIHTVSDMLRDHRDALADADLVRLAHVLGEPRLQTVPLEGERIMFADFLQRAFTDDGDGGGHLADEGVRLLAEIEAFGSPMRGGVLESVNEMKRLALLASREDQQRMSDRCFALLREEEAAGYELYRSVPTRSDVFVEMIDRDRYRPVWLLTPALSRVVTQKLERRARIEACLVGLASELYRRDTGAWPSSATDLSPRFLPFVPEDPVTGAPLALAPGERTITVYCVGRDGDDDGGVMDPDNERESRPRPVSSWFDSQSGRVLVSQIAPPPSPDAPDGDWVLFPAP